MNYQYIFSGTLPQNTPTYIERRADRELYQKLKHGEFCYVFNSRKTGKSSLRVKTMSRLQREGFACASLDLSLDEVELATPEQWYFGMVYNLTEDLALDIDLAVWWDSLKFISPLAKLHLFVSNILLKQTSQKIVIFIDEIDSVLSLNFPTDDFFALIRGCYNLRADNPDLERLGICLLGVATPTVLITDKHRTPFNIGHSIELTGFTFAEAQPLLTGLQAKLEQPEAILQRIIYWTCGQPFLTQKLCYLAVKESNTNSNLDIDRLVRQHLINNWEYQDEPEHLKTIRDRLLADEKLLGRLLEIYQKILLEETLPNADNAAIVQLKLSGLVVNRNHRLQVYNPIYQAVFDRDWIARQLSAIRPYAAQLSAWYSSHCQDARYLLNKAQLHQAQQWSVSRSLTSQDYKFLNASLNLERTKAEAQAQQILSHAKLQAKKQRMTGVLFSLMALVVGGWATWQIFALRHQRYLELQRRISLGENILLNSNLEKKAGANYFERGDFSKAAQIFARDSQNNPEDPESKIYLYNALAADLDPLTIAVAVPIGKNLTITQEMLRGVAQAQREANQNCDRAEFKINCGINGRPVALKIVNDDNEPQIAQWLAKELIKDREILAVVGHNASDVSVAAAKVYRDRLVMISPTSFFADFPQLRKSQPSKANYIFRTIPSLDKAISHIARYIVRESDTRPQLLICYDSSAVNSKSHVEAFERQNEIVLIQQPTCDFDRPGLNYERIISQAIARGANSLYLAPHIDRVHEAIAIAKVNYRQPSDRRLKLYSGSVLYTSKTLEDPEGRKAIAGMLLNVFWHPDAKIEHPYLAQAHAIWRKPQLNEPNEAKKSLDHNTLTWRSAMSYDATRAIIEAARQTPKPTRNNLQQALSQEDFSFDGATGKVAFKYGERVSQQIFLIKILPSNSMSDNLDFVFLP